MDLKDKVIVYREGDYAYVRFLGMNPYAVEAFLRKKENKSLNDHSLGAVSYKGWIISSSSILPVIQLLKERGFDIHFPELDEKVTGEKPAPKKKVAIKKKEPISGNSSEEIREARKYIRAVLLEKEFNGRPNFERLTDDDVRAVFDLYDAVFFDHQIKKMANEKNASIDFEVTKSEKATTAGRCRRKGCEYILSFPNGLYQQLFSSSSTRGRALDLAGWTCSDRLECLMIIFEHEVVHLLMMLWGYDGKVKSGAGKKIYSSHGALYQCMVKYYFGHTEYTHSLLNNDPSLGPRVKKETAKVGMRVQYKSRVKNRIVTGTIRKINPSKAKIETDAGIVNIPWGMVRKA